MCAVVVVCCVVRVCDMHGVLCGVLCCTCVSYACCYVVNVCSMCGVLCGTCVLCMVWHVCAHAWGIHMLMSMHMFSTLDNSTHEQRKCVTITALRQNNRCIYRWIIYQKTIQKRFKYSKYILSWCKHRRRSLSTARIDWSIMHQFFMHLIHIYRPPSKGTPPALSAPLATWWRATAMGTCLQGLQSSCKKCLDSAAGEVLSQRIHRQLFISLFFDPLPGLPWPDSKSTFATQIPRLWSDLRSHQWRKTMPGPNYEKARAAEHKLRFELPKDHCKEGNTKDHTS